MRPSASLITNSAASKRHRSDEPSRSGYRLPIGVKLWAAFCAGAVLWACIIRFAEFVARG